MTKCAVDLSKLLNFDINKPCGIPEIKILDDYFSEYQIMVLNKHSETLYLNTEKTSHKCIYLLYRDDHYDCILSMKAFFGRSYWCDYCKKGYNNPEFHQCRYTCKSCFRINCQHTSVIKCFKCKVYSRNQVCSNIHQERICNKLKICENCNQKHKYKTHVCINEKWCKNCKLSVDINHKCYVKLLDNVGNTDQDKFCGYIFFDFEAFESDTTDHKVNLAMAQKICPTCLDANELCNQCNIKHVFYNIEDYCKWALKQKNTIQIAHNMKGYDGIFILNYIINNMTPCEKKMPDVISNGTKILSLQYQSIKIIDSASFLPMPLEKFPKTFDIYELKKGFFPHTFNKPENYNYIGTYPSPEYYKPEFFTVNKKKEFELWYNKVKNDEFNFKSEFENYCWSDVRLLAEGCLKFRRICIEDTKLNETDKGVDPFRVAITIASYCNFIYRRNYMPENSIGIIPANGYNPNQKTSAKARVWLKYISEQENIVIKHANNTGEVKCGPYYLDGVCDSYKTIYEFHGCYWHGCQRCFKSSTYNTTQQMYQYSVHARHMTRIDYIKSKMSDYKLVEMWECDWDKLVTKNELLLNYIKSQDLTEAMNVRDSLYGGRTQAFKLYHKCSTNEKIKYIDYTSLYPYIQKYGIFPVGHPNIITENFDYSTDVYFGIIKVKMLPPNNLHIPVLPTRINGKLYFTLCRTCSELKSQNCNHNLDDERAVEGTYVTLEVYKAVKHGYKILKIYEVWQYDEKQQYDNLNKTGGIFTDYQNNAMKKKVESSGWPEHTQTDEQKQKYIDEFYHVEGIKLEKKNISKNSGRRQLAKLMANNQWGFLGMNSNKTQFKIIKSKQEWLSLLNDDKISIKNISFPQDDLMFVYYSDKDDYHTGNVNTNVVLASFVTAQARLKLFDEMYKLGDRVVYCDTDSIFYLTKGNEYEPSLGTNLGEFTNEIDPEDGNYIQEWVSAGKKNYAYKTDKENTHCTVKGFTFNYLTNLKLNFDSIKKIVIENQKEKITCEQLRFTRDKKKQTIQTSVQKKEYGFVYDTRILLDNFESKPYGYIS